ncbi:MAG: aminotransferase class V-fold PLP-dependent enzyme [Desulfobacterales bacterium]|nr:aminotransferase class V-fold PLP-dependent enzyme [Desulfobacterales bacterium]
MIPNQKHLFNIPEDITYLNCAYLSPQLRSVTAAGLKSVSSKEAPWLLTPPDFFTLTEQTRSLFAELIDARANDIAIIPAVSYGVSVATLNVKLEANQAVVVLEDQFPSNVYPWRELVREKGAKLKTVARPQDDDWTAALMDHIDENTAVVAIAGCHWTDGCIIDLVKLGQRCREINAALVIDATQSLGALPLSVFEVQPDFVIAASYKWLLGPYSLGFMYVNPNYHDGIPLEYNWINRKHSEDFAGLVKYRNDFQTGARRFDVGERSNFALMPMAFAALRQILDWQVPETASTLAGLTEEIAQRATDLDLNVAPTHLRAGHMLGIRFPEGVPDDLIDRFAQNKIYVSVRGNSIRISPHLYNTKEDIDKLFSTVLESL